MNRIRVVFVFVATLVGGSAAGWMRPLPTVDTIAGHEQQPWHLPSKDRLERSSVSLSSQARTLHWVGDAASGAETSPQDWILKAILKGEDAILVQSGKGGVISRTDVGARLPDGSRLLALQGDSVLVELDDCRRDRHLYPRALDSDPSPCKTATLQKEMQQP